jgi:hypothetical protein
MEPVLQQIRIGLCSFAEKSLLYLLGIEAITECHRTWLKRCAPDPFLIQLFESCETGILRVDFVSFETDTESILGMKFSVGTALCFAAFWIRFVISQKHTESLQHEEPIAQQTQTTRSNKRHWGSGPGGAHEEASLRIIGGREERAAFPWAVRIPLVRERLRLNQKRNAASNPPNRKSSKKAAAPEETLLHSLSNMHHEKKILIC